jgi:hypothetical protein
VTATASPGRPAGRAAFHDRGLLMPDFRYERAAIMLGPGFVGTNHALSHYHGFPILAKSTLLV